MKANELRIGNYVDRNGLMVITHISKIGLVRFYDTINRHHTGWFRLDENVKPIPLTEEWLVKFGFMGGQFMNGICIGNYNGFYINLYDSNGSLARKIKFEYVHQLQNFYFAITGKELTIK